MERVRKLIRPKVDPQQQVRSWQRNLRQESRNVDRQLREIEREEKNVQNAIKEAAKRNDMASAKTLAREIVLSRKTINRLHENRANINSISMQLGENLATVKAVGHISKSTEIMKLVNSLVNAPEVSVAMQKYAKEMAKAGLIEEMVNDTMDSVNDSEEIEEEINEEVDKVLTELAVETTVQLPTAFRREKVKVKPTSTEEKDERQEIGEGANVDV